MPGARIAVCVAAIAAVLAGCGGSRGGTDSREATLGPAWLYRGAGLTALVPAGWHVAGRPLTAVSSPVQRLVVTSFPLHLRRRDGGCRPRTALRELPSDGALLFMFEYRGPTHHDLAAVPARPRHFRLDPRTLVPYECMGRSYSVRFHDAGRVFQAHIYLGPRAGAAVRRRILAVLDSLKIDRTTPREAAVWTPPTRLLSRAPYLGVACRRPNHFACDRVGLAVWLRSPAVAVSATVDGRPVELDDSGWSGRPTNGRRRMFAGFLHPAGLMGGPLKVTSDDGPGRWTGRDRIVAGVGLTIKQRPGRHLRTSLRVALMPGWG